MHELPRTERVILLRAAQLIRDRGWCRDLLEHDGQICAIGAIILAGGFKIEGNKADAWDPVVEHAMKRVAVLCHRRYGFDNVPTWNDQLDRTAEDVIQLLEDAALMAA